MGKPIFMFGQPQVKWTEIDDSIVLPIHQNQEKNTLVLIDSEWGEPNKLEYISDSQTYVEKFGKLIDPTKSQKGYDYLPHYLQGNLQGNIPMYVYKIGFPDQGSTIDDYKQSTTYEIENEDQYTKELLTVKQKYQGLFGKDLGFKVYYNSLFKMYSIDVFNLISYVNQEDNDENEIELLESFKDVTFTQLIDKVNTSSKYINIDYYMVKTEEEVLQIMQEDLSQNIGQGVTTFSLQNSRVKPETVQITRDSGENINKTSDIPDGNIDGSNQTFQLSEDNIIPGTLLINLTEYQSISGEEIVGTFDNLNQNFQLQNNNIKPNTLVLNLIDYQGVTDHVPIEQVDGITSTFSLGENDIKENSVSITLTEFTDVSQETPSGVIDGQNSTFQLQNTNIKENSVSITLTEFTDVSQETPSGSIDGSNLTYTLQNTNIKPGTFSVVVDGGVQITDTDNGDGIGSLSDTGSITYQTGEFTLNQQPQTTVVQDYTYLTETTIIDDGSGNLSDSNGSINYLTGELSFATQPQINSELLQDYTYSTETIITDDGQGLLTDGGTIAYATGFFTLNEQPQSGSEIKQSFLYPITTTITDNGQGSLSDGGTIEYNTGTFSLGNQPQSTSEIFQQYEFGTIIQISDDGLQNLSDGGSINYQTGSFTLNENVQLGNELVQDYTYNDVEIITDDGMGNLSDGGTINYEQGSFDLVEQPTYELLVNYNYGRDIEVRYDFEHNISYDFNLYENLNLVSSHTEINGIQLEDQNIIKLNNQTNPQENGIYFYDSSTDMIVPRDVDFTYSKIYSLLFNNNFVIDFIMQYKDLSNNIIPRVKQQDQFNYFDGITDNIIKDNLDETNFNEQKSLEVDFSEGLTQLVENYEISSPDFGKIRYIQTLGLQEHTQFNDESYEHYEEYEQFINNIHTKLIQPRRNLVLITEPKDFYGEDQVTNQLQSSNDIWSDLKGSYISMYYPWILEKRSQLDLHLPPSFDVIQKLYQHTPNLQIQGIRRGRISESSIPVHVLSDQDKDNLSQDNVNSLMYFPHYNGTYIWDEKTHYNKLSQLSRLSQRLIMIEIEERVNREMGFFLFEPLVESTFIKIKSRQDYILSQYQRMNWIYDYQIDLDTSLELLDNHMVILKLLIKPIKNLEFVEIKQFVRSYQNQTEEF